MSKYYKNEHAEGCECGGYIKTFNKKLYKKWGEKHQNCTQTTTQEGVSSHERRPEYKYIGFIPDPEEYAAQTKEKQDV